jgi:hypothetical protein
MARSDRQDDGTRGAVGTMTRSGTRPRQAPDPGQPAPDPRRGRPARPVPPPRAADQQPGPTPANTGPASTGQASTGQRTANRRGQRFPPPRAAVKRAAAAPAAAAQAPQGTRTRIGAPWRVPSVKRATGPQPARTPGPQPVRTTGPQPVRTTGPQPAVPSAQPAQSQLAASAFGSHRMPFVLLLCGLLGGALISALVISTTLAEGSFQITNLQASTSSLARQRQTLEEQVAQAQSSPQIYQRAIQLGMRRPGELQFIDLKTGKTTNDGPTWSGAVNAPGYAP